MLMRYTRLDADGMVTRQGNPKVLYSIMQGTRIFIIMGAGFYLSQALMISVRYAHVRTQFKDKEGSDQERALIDY